MEDIDMKKFLFKLSVIKYGVLNYVKKNTYGIVSEYGKVEKIGFGIKEDDRESWYIDKVKYRFGKPIDKKRYWDIDEFRKDKNFEKNRIVVKGFLNEKI
jgi:hypothetical protein